jgi:hypothetical protein
VDWNVERECAESTSCTREPPAAQRANNSAGGGGGGGGAGRGVSARTRRGPPTAAEAALVESFQGQARRWLADQQKKDRELQEKAMAKKRALDAKAKMAKEKEMKKAAAEEEERVRREKEAKAQRIEGWLESERLAAEAERGADEVKRTRFGKGRKSVKGSRGRDNEPRGKDVTVGAGGGDSNSTQEQDDAPSLADGAAVARLTIAAPPRAQARGQRPSWGVWARVALGCTMFSAAGFLWELWGRLAARRAAAARRARARAVVVVGL